MDALGPSRRMIPVILGVVLLIGAMACTGLSTSAGSADTASPSTSPEVTIATPTASVEDEVDEGPLPLVDLARGTYFVNIHTGKAVPFPGSITSVPFAGNFDVSPDGSMILFDNSSIGGQDEPIQLLYHQLFVANIDGSDLRQLTRDPYGARHGSWSPDGSKVVYLGGWGKLCCVRSPADLIVLDVATRETVRLATGQARHFQHPIFSADGGAVIVTRSDPTTKSYFKDQSQDDLWTIPVGGGQPEILLEDRGYGSYSTDGATIAFTRIVHRSEGNAAGTYGELWTSDADGSDARILVQRGGGADWSPNGRWISYSRGGRLHVRDMTTGRSIFLSRGYGQDWVDDETLIVVRER